MQNDAALGVMRTLKVPVDAEIARLIAGRTNAQLEDYKLLTESMGGGVGPVSRDDEPHSRRPGAWRQHFALVEAFAAADEHDIVALLEQYRLALEAENLERVEALHVALPEPMRDALQKYFQNAERLRIRFFDVDVLVAGDEALATFTRSDDFVDAPAATRCTSRCGSAAWWGARPAAGSWSDSRSPAESGAARLTPIGPVGTGAPA